jgi:hypothetical protein
VRITFSKTRTDSGGVFRSFLGQPRCSLLPFQLSCPPGNFAGLAQPHLAISERTVITVQNERMKPAHEIRLGRIKAAIWENEGQNGKFFSVTIIRSYKDGTIWKDATSFSRDDLPLVAKVADRVHSWIYDEIQQRNSSRCAEPSDDAIEEL